MIEKTLDQISLQITEPEYRTMPELSYSNLSTYESVGFDGLDHLFDRKETPSLTLGSAVDSLITGGTDEFNERFIVMDTNVTDSGRDICKQLTTMLTPPYPSFEDIPESIISEAAKQVGFWKDDKWDARRYKEVLKTGNIAEYFNAMATIDKTILDTETYNSVIAMVRALRESPATKGYFADNDPTSPIQRYYQLKFKGVFNGVGYRGMMDLVIVDYEHKKIIPCDLKTASVTEWNFEKNFVNYHYYTQARTYWRLLRQNLDNDTYFKDFELMDFRFIVVNRNTLTPLVWEFPLTKEYGELIDDRGEIHRDPFAIGEELRHYLDNRPRVPDNINYFGVNKITCLKLAETTTTR